MPRATIWGWWWEKSPWGCYLRPERMWQKLTAKGKLWGKGEEWGRDSRKRLRVLETPPWCQPARPKDTKRQRVHPHVRHLIISSQRDPKGRRRWEAQQQTEVEEEPRWSPVKHTLLGKQYGGAPAASQCSPMQRWESHIGTLLRAGDKENRSGDRGDKLKIILEWKLTSWREWRQPKRNQDFPQDVWTTFQLWI